MQFDKLPQHVVEKIIWHADLSSIKYINKDYYCQYWKACIDWFKRTNTKCAIRDAIITDLGIVTTTDDYWKVLRYGVVKMNLSASTTKISKHIQTWLNNVESLLDKFNRHDLAVGLDKSNTYAVLKYWIVHQTADFIPTIMVNYDRKLLSLGNCMLDARSGKCKLIYDRVPPYVPLATHLDYIKPDEKDYQDLVKRLKSILADDVHVLLDCIVDCLLHVERPCVYLWIFPDVSCYHHFPSSWLSRLINCSFSNCCYITQGLLQGESFIDLVLDFETHRYTRLYFIDTIHLDIRKDTINLAYQFNGNDIMKLRKFGHSFVFPPGPNCRPIMLTTCNSVQTAKTKTVTFSKGYETSMYQVPNKTQAQAFLYLVINHAINLFQG